MFNDQHIKHGMLIIFMEILQLDCYAVPELPLSRNSLHNCTFERLHDKYVHVGPIWQPACGLTMYRAFLKYKSTSFNGFRIQRFY